MGVSTERFGRVEAVVTERACGGWLAVSAPGSILSVGTTGTTDGEARAEFEGAVRRFEALVDEHYQTHVSP
jgi:hypothetical protein